MTKKRIKKYLAAGIALLAFGCSKNEIVDNEGGLPIPSEDVFMRVPTDGLSKYLLGDWSIQDRITSSNCPEMEAGTVEQGKIRILEPDCLIEEDVSSGMFDGVNVELGQACQAGGVLVGIELTAETTVAGCRIGVIQTILMSLDKTHTILSGGSEGSMNLSGNCPNEVHSFDGCFFKSVLSGTRVWDATLSEGEPPPFNVGANPEDDDNEPVVDNGSDGSIDGYYVEVWDPCDEGQCSEAEYDEETEEDRRLSSLPPY